MDYLPSAVTHGGLYVFPGMMIRKMASASLTEGSLVHASLGTVLFMWTPFRCRGRLKTESQVGAHSPLGVQQVPMQAPSVQVVSHHSGVLSVSGTNCQANISYRRK